MCNGIYLIIFWGTIHQTLPIGYVTANELSYAKIDSVDSSYFIINKINGYIEKINGNKY